MKMLNRITYSPLIAFIIVMKDLFDTYIELSNGITFKIENMKTFDLIINIILVLWLVYILIGMRKFASSVIDIVHNQARFNQRIFKHHPEIAEEYLRDLTVLRENSNVNDIKKSFYNIFIFSDKKLSEYDLFVKTDLEYKKDEPDTNIK